MPKVRQYRSPRAVPRDKEADMEDCSDYAYESPTSSAYGEAERERRDGATHESLAETADQVQLIANEVCGLRRRVARTRRVAKGLTEEARDVRRAVRMQRAKRERIEGYVGYWQRVGKRMPFETLFGAQNGELVVRR